MSSECMSWYSNPSAPCTLCEARLTRVLDKALVLDLDLSLVRFLATIFLVGLVAVDDPVPFALLLALCTLVTARLIGADDDSYLKIVINMQLLGNAK